ncbi:hypothetical protein HYH03_014035 [Edaphochlamys debaryana]|uniref:8-oxo-dGTP diphosphatase n=1 Tax=Edaphochlamys debaryana TaxID=47281 RepID=A0A836BTX0_9CHLO|nr:hypothetical protein HYH03_014035 [Edaphochlamys debaryana]|eukprot:KAG2487318.1 hypothetical protein HYH03_014035 [Edaphochlamys debaryana]
MDPDNSGAATAAPGAGGGGSGGVKLVLVVGVALLDDPAVPNHQPTPKPATAEAAASAAAPLASPAAGAAAAASGAGATTTRASGDSYGGDGGSGGCSGSGRPVRVLLAQRPPGKANAGLWEFPGGKVDAGETPEAALVRELSEELGIAVQPHDLQPLSFVSHAYPTFHLLMPLYACRRWSGEPAGQEGQAVVWASAEQLGAYPLTPADVPLVPAVLAAMRGA